MTEPKSLMEGRDSPFTVSEFIEVLNGVIAQLYCDVVGEVTELKISAKGHVYFVLKDKDSGHVLPCTMWKYSYELNGLALEDGMEIMVKGKPEYYGPFGKLSFIAKSAELIGEGALKKAYDKLKQKLTEEGLFAVERKRLLPEFPVKIGVITSIHGAVIHDFSNNLRKSGYKVKILDCRVEGPESGRNLTLSLRAFRKEDIEVLVLIRGGGSMQSLAGFDNEALVREIARFPVPVVTGIGHHQDEPLAALVADAATSTPSFVAAMLNKSWEEAVYSLETSRQKILGNFSHLVRSKTVELANSYERVRSFLDLIFGRYEKAKDGLHNLLGRLGVEIARSGKQLESDWRSIRQGFGSRLKRAKTEFMVNSPRIFVSVFSKMIREIEGRIVGLEKIMQASNPVRQLKLGYSIAMVGGSVVRSVKKVTIGQQLEVRVSDGSVISKIEDVK